MTEQEIVRKKKSIFKRWWFWVIVVIVIGAAANAGKKNEMQPTSEAPVAAAAKSDTKQAEAAKAPATDTKAAEPAKPKKAKMTKAMFDQLKTGMSLEDAQKIIPGEWEIASESGTKGGTGTDIHTVMYQFDGDGSIGANANLMFQDEKLVNKAQMGLK